MVFLKSRFFSREQNVDRSDSGSDGSLPSVARLKTIYSEKSGSFTTSLTQPRRTRGWKPVSMKPPVLVSFILASLALVAAIEYFAQKSRKDGGLSLTENADDASSAVILSRYAPTVVAVIYSLAWTWIDLDIRRMQPWLEMSQGDGGTAESTVLLDYPFEFLAFIPIKAGRRKHWLVFLAGTTMMLVFWAITPLQSAIFGTMPVLVFKEVLATNSATLASLDQQLYALDASILNSAYAITWLKQPFPDFTTSSRAYLPFQPTDSGPSVMPDEAWTAETTGLNTDLECWPAIVSKTDVPHTFNFDNGRGCTQQLVPSVREVSKNGSNIVYTVLYIGYHEEAHLDWFLQNPNCSEAASHQFLAIWMSTRSEDMTALFCEPSYKKQSLLVTVAAADRRPDESTAQPRGELRTLSDDEFNSTAFEYLMGTGVPPKQIRRDYARDKIIDQYTALMDRGLAWPTTNMVGFALGSANYSLADLQNATALQDVFTAAHKTIFSAAISSMLVPASGANTTKSAIIQYTLYGIVVSRPISLAVEILLGLVSILVSLILFLSSRTYSSLSKDPGTIGSSLSVFKESSTLLRKFSPLDQCDRETLESAVGGDRFRLVETDNSSGPGLYIDVLETESNTAGLAAAPAVSKPTHHLALRPLSGICLVAVVLAGMVVLLYFKRKEQLLGGLPRPTDNFELLQLIENYIPTVFATLLEPFLVLINHLRCLLQPFRELRKGHKPAAKTLETSYISVPPQLVIFRALSAGHVLLASLCALSLLANGLAISLGALFNEVPVSVNYPLVLQQTLLPAMNRTDISPRSPAEYLDFFYVAMANLTYGTALPPWIDSEFAYFPFMEASGNRVNGTSTYTAQTRGFGVDTVCTTLQTSPQSLPYVDYNLSNDGTQSLTVFYNNDSGSMSNCTNYARFYRKPALNLDPSPLAQELATQLVPPRGQDGTISFLPDDKGFCERRLLMSWFRLDSDRNATPKSTHLDCVSTFRSAMFNLTVDPSGYVLGSQRVTEFEEISTISQNETHMLLLSANDLIGVGAAIATDSTFVSNDDAGWHNDTLTRDWMNFLLKLSLNSTRLVDPMQDLPTGQGTITAVQNLYKQLFSTALGLNIGGVFKVAAEPVQLSGVVTVPETRIFMDNTAFIITIVILGLNIVVTTVLYIQEGGPFLPRLPSTVGSLAAYIAASQAVREYSEPGEETGTGQVRIVGQEAHLYGFGKYLGMDGKEHVGVEMDPFVSPADDGIGVRFRGWRVRQGKKGISI